MPDTLHIQIDPHSGVPVYRQLMDQVKYYVAASTLKPGAQLPSIRDLARLLAINPATVVRAYSELEHEGIVEMRHGKGAFISLRATRLSGGAGEKALRRLARQLAVEAAQMGAHEEQVILLLREEISDLNP